MEGTDTFLPPPGRIGEQALWLLRHYPGDGTKDQLYEWQKSAALLLAIANDAHTHEG